ncbi:hypothetical protein [Streptomyces roseoverticillatus]|uniref:hypothetical protein n=1 Tax=Streptomyces roseoverticillatus TaxID=66429 RepID=UPI0004C07E6D|nr:hypothetical protein [Streptomyces roseoverticillatus]
MEEHEAARLSARNDRRQRRCRGPQTKSGALLAAALFALSACTSAATSPKELRRLADSSQATQAREKTEMRLRAVVQAYADRTPLTLGLVVVRDLCQGGSGKQWFFQDGHDTYKIKCSMNITAYYGADRNRIGDVLDKVLTAGDRGQSQPGTPGSTIPFAHDNYGSRLVEYYRGNGPNPHGSDAPEPTQLFTSGQTLTWDAVRDRKPFFIEEPPSGMDNDPPVTRFLREPESRTVSDIRRKHGIAFKLEIGYVDYYKVFKRDQDSAK